MIGVLALVSLIAGGALAYAGERIPAQVELLEGTGSQVRYVAVRSAADLKKAPLTAILQSAAAIVPPPRIRR